MIDLAKLFLSKVDLNKVESHKLQESSKTLSKYKGKNFTFDYPSNWEVTVFPPYQSLKTDLHYFERGYDKVALEDPDGINFFLISISNSYLSYIANSQEELKEFAENFAEERNVSILDYKYTDEYYFIIFENEDIVSITLVGEKWGGELSTKMLFIDGLYEKYRYEFYEEEILDILNSIKPV